MHRRRTGGAGVLDPRRRLEAQLRIGLQHQRGREILRREAGVEMAEHDLVDVCGGNAGIGQRIGRDLDHEALDGFGVELAEWRVRPSDDAGCHGRSPCFGSDRVCNLSMASPVSAISSPARTWRLCRPSCRTGYPPPGRARNRPPPRTFGSASQDAALASPMPPVGQNPDIRKRPRQRPQCLDTAGLLGREEFHQIEARPPAPASVRKPSRSPARTAGRWRRRPSAVPASRRG